MPFLLKCFNRLFHSGIFPDSWICSTIIPLHKKGDVYNPDNYRGISLMSIFAKIFTSILNSRLTNWANMKDKIPETQAGFRKNYSTTDHIFTLYAIVQKHLSRKKHKLYVAFVDFKKAFDTVDRGKLWHCLRNTGLKGKMYSMLKSMYSNIKSCVRCNNDVTDFFDCPIGLRQGCVLSPILFSFFISELYFDIATYGKHGVQLFPDIIEIFILLFADDVILVSDSVIGLQRQLDILDNYTREWRLSVNLDKTNIVIFRKGGPVATKEKWFIGNQVVSTVNYYTYTVPWSLVYP